MGSQRRQGAHAMDFPHLIETSTLWAFFFASFSLVLMTATMFLLGSWCHCLLAVRMAAFLAFTDEVEDTSLFPHTDAFDSSETENVMNYGLHSETWPNFNMYYWSTVYRWIVRDCKLPGTFAVIGMASFMGGSGRITVMLAIVMLELTGDAGMLAPVGLVLVFLPC